jgi:signal transduction histidine kinase
VPVPELDPEKGHLLEGPLASDALPRVQEYRLAAQLKAFERVHTIVANVHRYRSPEQRLNVLLHAFIHVIRGAQHGAIYLTVPMAHTFVIGAMHPAHHDRVGTPCNAKGSQIDAVAQLRTPSLLTDVEQETYEGYLALSPETSLPQSGLLVPFVVGGRTIGVLSLENADQRGAFSRQDLEFAALLGTHVAAIVDSARLVITRSQTGDWQSPELNAIQAMAHAMPVGVLLATHDGRQVWGNATFHQMTGYAQDELAANLARIHHKLAGRPQESPQHGGENLTAAFRLMRRDRTFCPVQATFVDLTAMGIRYPSGYIGIFEDLSEQSQLEQKLFHLQRLSNLSKLVSGVAHELNNPLTAVVGFAELVLDRDDLPADVYHDLDTIARQAERSTQVMRVLLDYVHLRDRTPIAVDLNSIVSELVRLREYTSNGDELEISLDLADPTPYTLGDAQQLQQVVLNLIDNAQDACKAAGRPCQLSVSTAHPQDEWVRVAVRDNGPGIAPEVQSRVFEPFFTTKPVGQGTGLGLAISKEIVAQHEGKLWFQSDPPHGTTFYVDLPLSDGNGHTASDEGHVGASTLSSAPARILIVDDEKSISSLLTKVLARAGHHVDAAHDGHEALEKLHGNTYDIVFLDLRIPNVPGQAIYDWIKQHRARLAERTVILTGDILCAETIRFLEEERVAHLLKPFQLGELRHLLARVWTM